MSEPVGPPSASPGLASSGGIPWRLVLRREWGLLVLALALSFMVFSLVRSDIDREQVLADFGGRQFSEFKPVLAELAVSVLSPINAEMRRLMGDTAEIDRVLEDGAERANAIAAGTMADVREIIGFL